jgi:hypothetical protein
MPNYLTVSPFYGPFTQKSAKFHVELYIDALVIGSMNSDTAKKYIKFYSTYL